MSATATIETAAKQETTDGRDARGRFAKGNKGGPGNPFARKTAELRKALVNFVTEDDMKHVAFILKEKAMGGDLAAIKLLFQYVIGKPTETVDPDRLDIDEWQKLKEQARPIQEMGAVIKQVPVEKACELTKIIWPCAFEQSYAVPMRAGLQAMDEADAQAPAAAQGCEAEKEKSRKQGMPSPKRGNGVPPRPAESSEAPTSLLDYLATWLPSEDGPPSQNGGNGAGGPPADWMEQLVRAAEEEKQARLAVNKRRKRVGQKRMKT